MNIGIVSDLHLDASNCLIDNIYDIEALAIIGDLAESTNLAANFLISLAQKTDIPIIYILGNHDYYYKDVDSYHHKIKDLLIDYPNIHVLQNESIIINDCKIIGSTLWTGFNLPLTNVNVDKMQIRRMFNMLVKQAPPGYALKWAEEGLNNFDQMDQKDYESATLELIKFLVKFNIADFSSIRKDGYYITASQMIQLHLKSKEFIEQELDKNDNYTKVVLTHFPIVQESIHQMYHGNIFNPYFCNHLPELLNKADFWFHGHVHNSFNYQLNDTVVACNPRGYSGTFNLNGNHQYQSPLILSLDKPKKSLKP